MLLLLLAATALAADPPIHRLPTLSAIYPQGAQPGTTTRVEVLGQHLDRVQAIYFTHPSLRARIVAVENTRLELEIAAAADAPIQPHYVRAISPRGASNLALFRSGDKPHRTECEPNSTLETAEKVSVPVTINARLNTDGDFDFFRFHAARGETLIFDLRAARNGSGLDASMVLVDPNNRRLEYDEDTFIWDPFFAYTFREEGDYIIAVQPTHARNDPGFLYQLDIRRAPHVQTLHPISLRPGAETEVTLFGSGLGDSNAKLRFDEAGIEGALVQARGSSAVAKIRVGPNVREGEHTVHVVSGGLSNPARFQVDASPVYSGTGPLKFPVSITGTAKYRQPERFAFHAEAGQTLTFETRAWRLGSPVDSTLRILDAKGKMVASNDDVTIPGVNFSKDSRVSHQFKEAGDYALEIRNLWQVTGENFPYQLAAAEAKPAYELQLGSDQPYIYPGESAKIKVSAVRRDGHKAGIPLSIEGLPAGFSAKPAEIAEGSNEAEIEVAVPADAKPGTHARIEVKGGQLAWRQVRISSGGGEGATFTNVDHAYLAVAEKPRFSLECSATAVNLVRGGTAELKVMIRRREGFTEPVQLRALNLPAGVTIEAPPAGADLGTMRLRAAPDAQLGRAARVAVIGEGGGQSQEAPKISVLVD